MNFRLTTGGAVFLGESGIDMKPFWRSPNFYLRGESLGELVIRPFQAFASIEAAGGILMIATAVAAMTWANSSQSPLYERIWHTPVTVGIGGAVLDRPLHFWINEGLMTLFFFLVGLEIKREILVGELASFRRAALPISAAIGGMVGPALIYHAFNHGTPASTGWAIPMATDIAFVVGALRILGSRVPPALTVFLVSLAIVDDLGAIVVIGLFYTATISLHFLVLSGLVLLILVGINILGFRNPFPYVLLGILTWLFVYMSGIHSTIAGVLVAMIVPARAGCDSHEFTRTAGELIKGFKVQGGQGFRVPLDENNQMVVRSLERLVQCVEPPLQRIEHYLHPWVVFAIMPVFALANAGVRLDLPVLYEAITSGEGLGIVLGLFVGKQMGVVAASFAAIRVGLADMPTGTSFRHIYGGAILCGIGFTMSLFICNISFTAGDLIEQAKVSILAGSLLSGLVGFVTLYYLFRGNPVSTLAEEKAPHKFGPERHMPDTSSSLHSGS
jgi:Na+:H+ antiporter, NhaA family